MHVKYVYESILLKNLYSKIDNNDMLQSLLVSKKKKNPKLMNEFVFLSFNVCNIDLVVKFWFLVFFILALRHNETVYHWSTIWRILDTQTLILTWPWKSCTY